MAGSVRDERAGSLLRRYRDAFGGTDLPVPVESIAEDLLGLSVQMGALDVSGMLLPAERRIFVNGTEPAPRQRFTIAHELGHWICQCLEGTAAPVMCRAQDVSEAANRAFEREANVFAAELLLPEGAIRKEWSPAATLTELAVRFGVSAAAMHWRLSAPEGRPQPCART